MLRSKEIQEQMRNKIADMYQSGKDCRAISKALGLQRTTVRAIIHKWRKLVTVVNLPRSGWPTKITPRVQRRLIQEVIKEPRTTSKELQASLASIKVSVHDSTIRKRLGKNSIHGRFPRQKPLLTKNNLQEFWANIKWTDETKVELFWRCVSRYIWCKTNTAFHKKNIIPTVKTLQCGLIKTILQRRVGQNSSTVMWKTHCQLSQMLDCSCCCKVCTTSYQI